MAKGPWNSRKILSFPALVLALAGPLEARAQTPTYTFGTAANGLRLCYPTDPAGGILAGAEPLADDLCQLTYQLGMADDGTQRCFPAESSGAILVGRQPVDSTFCQASPPPMTTTEQTPPPGEQVPGPVPPGTPGSPQPPAAAPLIVKINSVNDVIDPNHAREIFVHPGDMIRLGADHFEPTRGYAPMRSYAEDFVWSASDFQGDVCDLANRSNCFGKSNFQSTNYGAIFYVPYTIGEAVTVTVTSHNPRATDAAGAASFDTIILRNANFGSNWLAPKVVITSAEDYRYDKLNADLALAGHGHWVWIESVRYFVPTTYVFTDKRPWEPYRHGYWAFDNANGWTWISYDPWGWFTDHYGVWRYHGMYGWIWLPFADLHYVPHAVTFFSANGYIGWFPYHENYAHAYRHGRREAFIDGFEYGFRAAQYAGDSRFHPGFTLVQRAHFNQINVFNYTITNQTTIVNVTNHVMVSNAFGRMPGGNMERVRKFVAESRGQIPVTQTVPVHGRAGGRLIAPSAPRPMPAVYTALARNTQSALQTPVPLGTTRILSARHPDRMVKTIAPSINGKAFAVPAHGTTEAGKRFFMPPLTANPTQANKQNVIYQGQATANPPAPGQAMSKPLPAFKPEKAPPAPPSPQAIPNSTAPGGVIAPPPVPRMQAPAALKDPEVPSTLPRPKGSVPNGYTGRPRGGAAPQTIVPAPPPALAAQRLQPPATERSSVPHQEQSHSASRVDSPAQTTGAGPAALDIPPVPAHASQQGVPIGGGSVQVLPPQGHGAGRPHRGD